MFRVFIFHFIHLPCFYAIGSFHILLNYVYIYVFFCIFFFFQCWPVIVIFIVIIEYLIDLLLVQWTCWNLETELAKGEVHASQEYIAAKFGFLTLRLLPPV
jgi:hypothetical protein